MLCVQKYFGDVENSLVQTRICWNLPSEQNLSSRTILDLTEAENITTEMQFSSFYSYTELCYAN